MSNMAARPCDRVLPVVLHRQCVISLRREQRLLVAHDPTLQVFFEEGREWLRASGTGRQAWHTRARGRPV